MLFHVQDLLPFPIHVLRQLKSSPAQMLHTILLEDPGFSTRPSLQIVYVSVTLLHSFSLVGA